MKLIIAALLIGLSMQSSFAMVTSEKSIVDQMLERKRKKYEKIVARDVALMNSATDINNLTYTDKDGCEKPLIFKYSNKSAYAPLLKILLTKKADPNVNFTQNYQLFYPLMNAVSYGVEENISLLLEHKANPNIIACDPSNEKMATPLVLATKYKNIEIMRMLLEAQLDSNFTDVFHKIQSPLLQVVGHYCRRSVYDLKVKSRAEYLRVTPYYWSNETIDEDFPLENFNVSMNEEDKKHAFRMISLLMEHKADPNKLDPTDKISPLEFVQMKGYSDFAALMTSKTH
jgi:hypothetical protein